MSTIAIPHDVPDSNTDCIALRTAFDDIGCDKKVVLEIICHRNQQQRRRIRDTYRDKYEEDLIQRLKSELHSKLERAVVLWMCDPAERYAIIIKDALRGWCKDEFTMAEVICSRTTSQLQDIRQAYSSMFSRSLEEDIGLHTSGDEKKLFLNFIRQNRPEEIEPDMSDAQADAKDLLTAVCNRNGIDKAAIITILSTRSSAQLKAALDVYKASYGQGIGKVLKQDPQALFLLLLRTVMKCIQNPVKYFTKALYLSMKRLGTDDTTLIRIVVTRAEIDMEDIKARFVSKHKKTLEHMISSDTSRYYRAFLLSLVGAQPQEHRSGSLLRRLSSH